MTLKDTNGIIDIAERASISRFDLIFKGSFDLWIKIGKRNINLNQATMITETASGYKIVFEDKILRVNDRKVEKFLFLTYLNQDQELSE